MRPILMSFVALGGLGIGGVAAATPPDDAPDDAPLPPAEPNLPPPSQPDDQPDAPTDSPPPVVVPAQAAPTAAAATPAPTVEVVPYDGYRPGRYSWYAPHLASDIGIAMTVGGGVTGFTDRTMRAVTTDNVGGLWDFHLALGTHVPIGVELAYVGTASSMQSLSGFTNGTLVGTAVEGDLRWNILWDAPWTPYLFAGLGWQHYSTVDNTLSTADSGMKNSDNVAEFPLGAGLSFRDASGFVFDLRGTFRATTNSTLLFDPRTSEYASLHTWEASAALGYEF
jgi:hypothetical protein